LQIAERRVLVPVSLKDSRGALAFEGEANYDIKDDKLVIDNQVIPQTILFESVDGPVKLRMAVKIRNGVAVCTDAGLESDDRHAVQATNFRRLRIEAWVTDIVAACARKISEQVSEGGRRRYRLSHGPATPEQKKVAQRMQRRRRGPQTDRELHERVAAIHKLHPDAPNPAVAAEFGVSERTASRWAQYASDAGLLPKVKQGQKRT
jgi:hypothetical protein